MTGSVALRAVKEMLCCVRYFVNIQQITATKDREGQQHGQGHGLPDRLLHLKDISNVLLDPGMFRILLLRVYKESDSWLFEVRTDNSCSWPQEITRRFILYSHVQ